MKDKEIYKYNLRITVLGTIYGTSAHDAMSDFTETTFEDSSGLPRFEIEVLSETKVDLKSGQRPSLASCNWTGDAYWLAKKMYTRGEVE